MRHLLLAAALLASILASADRAQAQEDAAAHDGQSESVGLVLDAPDDSLAPLDPAVPSPEPYVFWEQPWLWVLLGSVLTTLVSAAVVLGVVLSQPDPASDFCAEGCMRVSFGP